MASIQLVQKTGLLDLGITCVFTPVPDVDDDAIALARSVMVALNTDRRALADDKLPLPNSDDRRGWWGDTNAREIWGGWPIGVRLWLMIRDKITDANARQGSTIERARRFIAEALQPFVDAKIASGFAITLTRQGLHHIGGGVVIQRGPKEAISLEYQELWSAFSAQ